MRKIVVLNSGGFDSIVLLNYLRTVQCEEYIHSLHFKYGALNEKQQLECVNKVCEKLNIENKQITLPPIDWTKSKFFEEGQYGTLSSQYLEYRNLIFLAYAISYAESIGAELINLALINNSDYPDASLGFLQGLNSICNASNIEIDAPFIFDSKRRLVHIANYLGIKKDEYFSCDTPVNNEACGLCPDCVALEELWGEIEILKTTKKL